MLTSRPLQYAAVMGITKELKLKDNEFSNIATFLFVALLCFEIPNSASSPSPPSPSPSASLPHPTHSPRDS